MSVDKDAEPSPETGQPTRREEGHTAQGGWKVKAKRPAATPPIVLPAAPDTDIETASMVELDEPAKPGGASSPAAHGSGGSAITPQVKIPSSARARKPVIDRQLLINGKTPEGSSAVEMAAKARARASAVGWRATPRLLLTAVALAGIAIAALLGNLVPWFGDAGETSAPGHDQRAGEHSPPAPAGSPVEAAVAPPSLVSPAEGAPSNQKVLVRAIALPAMEDEGRVPVYFKLAEPIDRPVEVTYETRGHTAKADADFKPMGGTVTIPAGKTLANLVIPLVNDDVAETAEMFHLVLSVDRSSADLSREELTATVIDDDDGRRGTQ